MSNIHIGLDLSKSEHRVEVRHAVFRGELLQSKPVNDTVNLSARVMSETELLANSHEINGNYMRGDMLQASSSYGKLLGGTSAEPLIAKVISLSKDQATLETDFGLVKVNIPIKTNKESFSKNIPVFETTSHIKSKKVLLNSIVNGKVISANDKSVMVKTPLGNMELNISAHLNAGLKINIVEKLLNGSYKIQVQMAKSNLDSTLDKQLTTKAIATSLGANKSLKTLKPIGNHEILEKGVFSIHDKQLFSVIIKRQHTDIREKQQASIDFNAKVIRASNNKVIVKLSSGSLLELNNNNLDLKENENVKLNIHSLENNLTSTKPQAENLSELKKLFTTLTNDKSTKNRYININNGDKTYKTSNLLHTIIPQGMPLGAGSLFVAQAMFSMISMNNPTIIANIVKIFMGVNPDFKNLKFKNIKNESIKLVNDKQENTWKSYDLPFIMSDNKFKELKVYHRLYTDEELQNESAGKRFLIEMNLSMLGGKIQLDGITKQDKRIFDLILRTNQLMDPHMATTIKKIFITTLNKHSYTGTINFNHTKSFIDFSHIL